MGCVPLLSLHVFLIIGYHSFSLFEKELISLVEKWATRCLQSLCVPICFDFVSLQREM